MLFFRNFTKLSARARSLWLLLLILFFTAIAALAVGGQVYNNWTDVLAEKTNNIVVLPKVAPIPFSLGLDLQGGSHLVYRAEVDNIAEADRDGALEAVRDVIERRVNAFGVSEPVIQVNKSFSGEYRIIAELAGIKDVEEAIKLIGETPILEFKEQDLSALESPTIDLSEISEDEEGPVIDLDFGQLWANTELTGKNLRRASVQFNPNDGMPEVLLEFDAEGSKFFEDITSRNVGQPVAIFLDGYPISVPTVNEKITGGQATISGNFNLEEAKLLVTRLNSGALPVPVTLIAQKTVEASLGAQSIASSLLAGLLGLLLVSLFMMIYYRLPGLVSVVSLVIYSLAMMAIFKALPLWSALLLIIIMVGLIFYIFHELKIFSGGLALLFSLAGLLLFIYALKPVTLSLSGIAGLILSLGMAVDANILIFSRMKEELRAGKSVRQAADDGFKRAWPSVRDGNISTLLTCLILMFFGTSSVQGFGTTLFIGIVASLFSAIVVTRTLLSLIIGPWLESKTWLLSASVRTDNNK